MPKGRGFFFCSFIFIFIPMFILNTTAMKDNNQLFNKTKIKNFRKHLRSNLTPAEATLWPYLKNRQLDGCACTL
jgi:hypothetical protein